MPKKNQLIRYIAFLRGINVGGHRVKMDQLRDLFTALKLTNVSTFIASGNVIFETPNTDAAGLEKVIGARLEKSLGYAVETFLRTPEEVASLVAFRPFSAKELDSPGYTLHIGFLRNALSDQVSKELLSFRTKMDDFHVRGRDMYWLCRGRTLDSEVKWHVLTKMLGMPSTMRNVKMLRKLVALHS